MRSRLPFFAKLVLSHVAVALVVVVVMAFILHASLRRELLANTHAHSHAQARGTAQWVDRDRHPERLAPRLAAVMGARVSILDAQGKILGDSAFPRELEPQLDNQAAAPEMTQAVNLGDGRSVRRDENNVLTQYSVAQAGDGLYVRVGVPVSEAVAPLGGIRAQLVWAAVLSAILAVIFGLVAARLSARPLREMRVAAERISAGELDVTFTQGVPLANDDVGALQRALATMAGQLGQQISDLTAQRDQLGRMAKSARELVANVSHELRTPVMTIGGFAETLLHGNPDDATRREFTEIIARSSDRMNHLITDLLQLAKLDTQGAGALPLELVDLREVVQGMSPSVTAAFANIATKWHADAPVVRANADALVQVLENLLVNAQRHGKASAITIETAADPAAGTMTITVTDNGAGIDPRHLPNVTERFYCADPARSRSEGGAGLGLAIVKQFVELQGGTLAITSTVGAGTAVAITLPTV